MENIKDYNVLSDPFLERMVQSLPQQSLPGEFTIQVMNQIYASVEPVIEPEKYRRQMLWAYFLIGAGILAIALILFALWPFIELNFKLDSSLILKFITASLSVLDGISNVIDYLKESSIQLSIFFSVFILFLVERLLRKGATNSGSFML